MGYSQNTPVLALGTDRWYAGNALVGFAVSLGLPKYRADGWLDSDGRMITMAAYGLFNNPGGGFNIGWSFGHTWANYDQHRILGSQRYAAKYHGNAWQAALDISRPADLGKGLIFTPRLGYDFIHLKTSAYKENSPDGFNTLALDTGKRRQNIQQISLWGELYRQSETGLELTAGIGWLHRPGNLRGEAVTFLQGDPQQRAHKAVSEKLAKNSIEARLGVGLPKGHGWNLNLNYNGIYSAHTQTHGGDLMFSLRF